jgi:hypothetical protein
MRVINPAGVSQSDELDYILHSRGSPSLMKATCLGGRDLGYRVFLVEDDHSNICVPFVDGSPPSRNHKRKPAAFPLFALRPNLPAVRLHQVF